ncbi:hypothetical protein CVIRNUC_006226 [Coccomyxa viridis]|uniref:nitrile hydratase n=1 Tax=Coccomyxa viridis TaxID=1274662 RepID=A0AAV1I6Q0_9CHLO|nr:hypothetical protein CVIRNUC_006226 [Coccomyxa viridis]
MAPAAWKGSDLHYQTNAQDVARTAGKTDPFPAVDQPCEDAADTPLSVALKKTEKPVKYWEYQCHALCCLLVGGGHVKSGEVRRAIEYLPPAAFQRCTYYEKWANAVAVTSIERGTISQKDLDEALGGSHATPEVLYKPGDYVRVKVEDSSVRYRKPHLRTPGYLFGVVGRIDAPCIGYVEEPDIDAFHWVEGPMQPTYRITFYQKDLWEGYQGTDNDTLEIEIWQSWLLPSNEEEFKHQQANRAKLEITNGHKHDHGDHVHDERMEIEQKAVDAEGDDAERSRLTKALVKCHIDKGVIKAEDLTAMIEELESYGSRGLGARMIARAWSDPKYKALMLKDGASAAAELGIEADGWPANGGVTEPNGQLAGVLLKVVEDTPEVYNLLVCTLCSCYPISILGMAPSWYKARSYRARSVRDPRGVLKDFGTTVPEGVAIQICDSNADTRFIKIPLRPAGTEGWTEDQLQALVTRDAVIGVRHPKTVEEFNKEGGVFHPKSEGYKGKFIYQ